MERATRSFSYATVVAVWVGVALPGTAMLGLAQGRAADRRPGTGTEMEIVIVPPPAPVDPALAPLGIDPAALPWISSWRADLEDIPQRLLDAYLERPESWRHEVSPILASHDVPEEFLYLALVESGMDPAAESPAAAVGLWQFTAHTAEQYGLVVREEVDERLDWRRATWAAGRYLRDLYERFGSWPLAAAAYNAGPGRVSRALAETGSNSYWELLEAGRLPAETRAYVPKFLAIVQLAASRREASRQEAAFSTADD